MDKKLLDLYSDYLMVSSSQVTSTGLSNILDNEISHDKITRFLAGEQLSSKDLWNKVKKVVRKIESDEAVLCFDDSVEEKLYTDENDLICWHRDHSINRTVKGINQLTMLYYSTGVSIPVAVDFVKKTKFVIDKKTGKEKRISEKTKNEYFREMLKVCVMNQMKFKYATTDSWYANADNMNYIKKDMKKDFVMALPENRLVALSLKDKIKGEYQRVDSLELKEATVVYLESLEFPVLIAKKVLQDQNGKEVDVYLVSSDLTLDTDNMFKIYQKRWKIEEFFKSMKSNCSYSKSPTQTVTTQCNHFFCSVYAVFKYEMLRLNTNLNHFALKSKIYLSAMKTAMAELQEFKKLDNFIYS